MAERRLILLRHAEAATPGPAASDRDRLLTPSGEREAVSLARRLAAHGWCPDALVSSPAARALATTLLVRSAMQLELEPQVIESLYEGGLREVQGAIAAATASTLLIVGHNPTFSSAASLLAGTHVGLGTANAALLALDAPSWADAAIQTARWQLVAHLVP
jgi:phosphohistidine phosphatase